MSKNPFEPASGRSLKHHKGVSYISEGGQNFTPPSEKENENAAPDSADTNQNYDPYAGYGGGNNGGDGDNGGNNEFDGEPSKGGNKLLKYGSIAVGVIAVAIGSTFMLGGSKQKDVQEQQQTVEAEADAPPSLAIASEPETMPAIASAPESSASAVTASEPVSVTASASMVEMLNASQPVQGASATTGIPDTASTSAPVTAAASSVTPANASASTASSAQAEQTASATAFNASDLNDPQVSKPTTAQTGSQDTSKTTGEQQANENTDNPTPVNATALQKLEQELAGKSLEEQVSYLKGKLVVMEENVCRAPMTSYSQLRKPTNIKPRPSVKHATRAKNGSTAKRGTPKSTMNVTGLVEGQVWIRSGGDFSKAYVVGDRLPNGAKITSINAGNNVVRTTKGSFVAR